MGIVEQKKLDVIERKSLRKLEKTISDGMRTFHAVGDALFEIQESRLYREKHKTFEAYCQNKWDFSRQRAHQITGAAQVRASLSKNFDILPETEAQAAPLVGLDEEATNAAWGEAIDKSKESGEKITGVKVKEAVKLHESIDEPYEEPTEAPEPLEVDRAAIMKKGRKALGELVRALDDLEIEWDMVYLPEIKRLLK